MADARTILLNLLGKETVSRAAKKAADGLDDLGDSADKATRDAKELDRQLADTERSLADITRALAKDPGDSGLRRQLRDLRRESRLLQSVKKDFDRLGDDAGKGFAMKFVGRLGPIFASAPVKAPLIAAVAAAAPQISAVLSAAVVGGVGIGAAGIGAALVARRTEVQKAGKQLADDLLGGLTADAGPMVEPILAGMDEIRAEARKLRPEFQAIFTKAATFVPILSHAIADAADEIVPDLREVVDAAEPAVRVIGEHIPRAASTAGSTLKLLARDAEATAGQLDALLTTLEVGASQAGTGLFLLNQAAKYTTGWQTELVNKFSESSKAEQEAAAAAERHALAISRAGTAAERTAEEIAGMNQAVADGPREALAAEQATLRNAQAWDQLRASIKEAGRDGKLTSDEFYDLNGQVLDYADSTLAAADAVLKQTGSQDRANAVLDRGRANFIRAAKAAGMNADAVQALADKIFGLPGQRTTKINVNKQQAERDLDRINRKANNAARTRYLNIIAHYTQPSQSGALGAVGQIPREKGGPVRRGEAYLVGEKRPEVFVPNQSGMIYPSLERFSGQGRQAGNTPRVVLDVTGTDEDLKRLIRKMVRTDGGGNVQVAFGR